MLEIMKEYKPFESDRLSKSEEEPNTIWDDKGDKTNQGSFGLENMKI